MDNWTPALEEDVRTLRHDLEDANALYDNDFHRLMAMLRRCVEAGQEDLCLALAQSCQDSHDATADMGIAPMELPVFRAAFHLCRVAARVTRHTVAYQDEGRTFTAHSLRIAENDYSKALVEAGAAMRTAAYERPIRRWPAVASDNS